MKSITLFLLVALLSVFNSQFIIGQTDEFTVKVVDKITNKPLKSAKVSIREMSYIPIKTTQSDGTVYFRGVPNGRIEILIENFPKYYPLTTTWVITSDKTSNVVKVELEPIPETEYTFFGRIIDTEGNNIYGAQVVLRVGNIVKEVVSNQYGSYFINIKKTDVEKIKDYNYTIEINASDFKKYEYSKSFYPQLNYLSVADIQLKKIPDGVESVFLSIPFPGLGQYKVREKKTPYFLIGTAGYILLVGGVYMNLKSRKSWEDYLIESNPTQIISLRNKSKSLESTSKILYGAAALVWAVDIVSVMLKGNKNQRQKADSKKFGAAYLIDNNAIVFSIAVDF